MDGRPLNQLELLSLAAKDEQYYREWIDDGIQELAQSFFGMRKWIKLRNAITFLSRFVYRSMTTLSNIPTPGEEFCDAQVLRPNLMRHLLMVLLNNELQPPSEIPKFYGHLLNQVHMITYFLFGDFYELSKRVTNFSYSTQDTSVYEESRIKAIYTVIGFMSIIRLIADVSKHHSEIYNATEPSNPVCNEIKTESIKPYADQRLTCHLCSDARTEPTSTICGHIFCWNCIHRWLKERSECPICKTPTEPSRLIHLINFK